MWRSSPDGRQAGFTLIEVLVALISLVIVLTLAAELLFATRTAARRQEIQVGARQTARGAVDYTTFLLRGANDQSEVAGNSLALLFWVTRGNNPTPIQVSYDNNTNPNFADVGTDIITFVRPTGAGAVTPAKWPGQQDASTQWWGFTLGCDGSADQSAHNMQLFQDLTSYDPDTGMSGLLLMVDDTGQMDFYQITNYHPNGSNATCCTNDPPGIHVNTTHGRSSGLNPPGGEPNMVNPRLILGLEFMSLRVRNGWLEQKIGIFDPASDNPGTDFAPILPNVEDLQLAYIFNDGSVWNNLPTHTMATTAHVPTHGTGAATDASNITAIRITVTARAGEALTGAGNDRFLRPQAENHDGATVRDRFFRYELSAVALLRNRLEGS
jgi:prepilin-type N-terminal cleavage/methylation domain-containing protein